MKKIGIGIVGIISIIMLITACVSGGGTSAASKGMALDQAIKEASIEIDQKIEAGSKIALLNFTSATEGFSSYVLDELTANLVGTGKLVVVDRKEMDLIRSESNFQLSGEVSDDSIQAIGQKLGAQSIVSGSLQDIGGSYRIVIRVLNVESAAVAVQYRNDIAADSRVLALLGKSGTASGGRQTAQTSSRPAAPKDGTYTFYPRPRSTIAGVPGKTYLDKVFVHKGFMTVYLLEKEKGEDHFWNEDRWTGYTYAPEVLLESQDTPGKTWKVIRTNDGDDSYVGAFWVFENVTGTRFILTSDYQNPPRTLEFTLGEPD